MADWKQSFLDLIPTVPFFMVTKNGVLQDSKVNTTRVLESLIIAGITGSIIMYGVQQKLDVQMSELRVQINEVKVRIADEKHEAANRIERVDDKIEDHIKQVMQSMSGQSGQGGKFK